MASQAHLDKMQLRQNYRGLWHTDLMRTMQSDPPYCCLSFWCGHCVSYMLQKRALYNDMPRYVCCAGYMPCSCRCGESRALFCLATEGLRLYANNTRSKWINEMVNSATTNGSAVFSANVPTGPAISPTVGYPPPAYGEYNYPPPAGDPPVGQQK